MNSTSLRILEAKTITLAILAARNAKTVISNKRILEKQKKTSNLAMFKFKASLKQLENLGEKGIVLKLCKLFKKESLLPKGHYYDCESKYEEDEIEFGESSIRVPLKSSNHNELMDCDTDDFDIEGDNFPSYFYAQKDLGNGLPLVLKKLYKNRNGKISHAKYLQPGHKFVSLKIFVPKEEKPDYSNLNDSHS